MKSASVKNALFAALALVSLSCFIYVNTTSIDRALQAEGVATSNVLKAEKPSKNAQMPDLTLFKSAISLIQNFFPAK
jgi:hypothetical protein